MKKIPISEAGVNEQRRPGRRRKGVPVPTDRRTEERRDVPGLTELLEDVERVVDPNAAPGTDETA